MILWTILTAVLFLTLLLFLAWALYKIHGALIGVRANLEKIAMGVRAIEIETGPLPGAIQTVAAGLTGVGGELSVVDQHLAATVEGLPAAARALGLIR